MLSKIVSRGITAISICLLFLSVSTSAFAATTYTTPTDSEFKAYMSYKAITNKNSAQYKLQQECYTDINGLRSYGNRYTVAVGTFFNANVGTNIDVELSTGTVLLCTVGDIKQNIHTDVRNMQASNGNIIEFIVDEKVLSPDVKKRGDISYVHGFDGYISKVTVYDEITQEQVNTSSLNIAPVTEVAKVTEVSEDLHKISYESQTDLSAIYVESEIFESVSPTEEIFVTYSNEEISVK